MVKHNQTIRWLLPTNCFSVFDHVAGLGLKGLNFKNVSIAYLGPCQKSMMKPFVKSR